MQPPLTLFDSHCHLDLEHFDEDREAVIARARESGVRLIVNPGIDLAHSKAAIALADQYDEVYAAVGIHPNSAHPFADQAQATRIIDELATLAQHPKVVAIGEIGLDYYWDKVELDVQKKAFTMQLALAARVGYPVIIHSRESNEDVADILRQWRHSPDFAKSPLAQRPFAGVLHAFSGDLTLAEEAYTWDFLISLGGPVTFKNAKQLHSLVPELGIDRVMLETDAPFLTPHPFRGQRNEPAQISLVCHKIAELCGLSAQTVASASSELACRFFRISM